MASGSQDREGQFVEISRGFHGVPAGSRVLRGTKVDDTQECSWRLLPRGAGLV
jgi:hypothetical protein